MAKYNSRSELAVEAALVLALPAGGATLTAWGAMMVGPRHAAAVLFAGLAMVGTLAVWGAARSF